MHIVHTGALSLSHSGSLLFPNSLNVPHMSQNILSVSCLCDYNDVDIVFSSPDFQVKDQRMGDVCLRGWHVNSLYYWPSLSAITPVFTSIRQPLFIWHEHLGHPSSKVLDHIVSSS